MTIRTALELSLLVILIGFLGPFLISAKSTIAVIIGVALIIGCLVYAVKRISKIFNLKGTQQ